MDLDDIHDVEDHSPHTLQAMIARLRLSRTEEQFIYRETELDQMWRVVDIAVRRGDAAPAQQEELVRLRTAIERAHDLVGMDSRPLDAAATLAAVSAAVSAP